MSRPAPARNHSARSSPARVGSCTDSSTCEARCGTRTLGRIRNRLLHTTRFRLARRAASVQPMYLSRSFKRHCAALKASAPTHPCSRAFHQVANLSAAQRPLAQIVEPIHQPVPDSGHLAVATGNRHDPNLTQFLQAAAKLKRLQWRIRLRLTPAPLETGLPGCRQPDQLLSVQLQQGLAAAHLFELPVVRSPLQRFAYPSRRRAPGHRQIGRQDLLDPRDRRSIEIATT